MQRRQVRTVAGEQYNEMQGLGKFFNARKCTVDGVTVCENVLFKMTR